MRYLILLLLSFAANAETISGQVLRVTDGDTFVLADKTRVRLAQIDAPEIAHFGNPAQPFGKEAKEALTNLVLGAPVEVQVITTDLYGRKVRTVYKDGHNINTELVRQGLAWVYRQYSYSTELLITEVQAKASKSGLWADSNPTPPWEFRKLHK